MKVKIDKIKVTERIRKNIGNIEELAADIRKNGLICPIAVMRSGNDYTLLAGFRRLMALKMNGETEADVNVIPAADAEAALKIEFSENEQRMAFTFSEKMEYAQLIEDIEREKARERMSSGIKRSDSGSVRDIIGEKIGISGRQYNRAKYVAEHASPEVIGELDSGKRKVSDIYNELREKKAEEREQQTERNLKMIKQRSERLPLDQIVALPYEQRPQPARVRYIVDNFEAAKFAKPLVSCRDGKYYLIDGYHRVAALLEMGVSHATFLVLDGLTADGERELRLNNLYGYNKKSNKSGGNTMSTNANSQTGAHTIGTKNAPLAVGNAVLAPTAAVAESVKKRKTPNQTYALVPLDKLVETEYQRATSTKQMNGIIGNFDEDRLDPLVVAQFGDSYHIIDGLHRSRVMKILEYTHAYARVLTGLSFEQAADLFRRQNEGKRQVSTFDEFRAGIFAKDPMCLTIQKIVSANKYHIGHAGKSFYCIESVNALTTIAKIYGYDVLDETLFLLAATWGGIAKASQREYLLGAAEFIHRYGMAEFADRLKDKFAAVQYDYYEAMRDASAAHVTINGGARKKLCQILVKHYNKGLGSTSKKRLNWEVTDDAN